LDKRPGVAGLTDSEKRQETEAKSLDSASAEKRVGTLSEEQLRALARLSLVQVPMPMEVADVLREGASLQSAVSLGLLETTETTACVPATLRPLLQPMLTQAEWKVAGRMAARTLYERWWNQAEGHRVDQAMEVLRLGLAAGEREVAVSVADALATMWFNRDRFEEARAVCQQVLQVWEDYRLLSSIARSEQALGDTSQALQHYERALATCPADDERRRSAGLHNLAGLCCQQGQIERALELWQQSLEIDGRTGNVQGEAVTLANMAWAAGERGNSSRRDDLYRQAASGFGKAQAYADLAVVLGNLGATAERERENYAAQAAWLVLRVEIPIERVVGILVLLFQAAPPGDPLEALLAGGAVILVQARASEHPQYEDLKNKVTEMLAIAVHNAGVAEDDVENWMQQTQLNDPAHVFPSLTARLEGLVGDRWLFDRTPLLT